MRASEAHGALSECQAKVHRSFTGPQQARARQRHYVAFSDRAAGNRGASSLGAPAGTRSGAREIRVLANSNDRFLSFVGRKLGLKGSSRRDRDAGMIAIKSSSFIHTVIRSPEEISWAKGRLGVERRQQRYRAVNKSRMNERTRRAPYSNVFEGEYPLTNRFSWPIPCLRARARARTIETCTGRVSHGRPYTWRVNKGRTKGRDEGGTNENRFAG